MSKMIRRGAAPKNVNARTWHSSHVAASIRRTTATNMCRENDRTSTNACRIIVWPLTGSVHLPRRPKSTCASSPGGGSSRPTVMLGRRL